MKRISIIGMSGSGKTTLGRRLAGLTGIGLVELDALFWRPGWEMTPRREMTAKVEDLIQGDRWIIDGNYSWLAPVIRARADTLIWIDLPLWRNLWNVLRRGIVRALSGELLWGHSRETLPRLFSRESLLLWVWNHHGRRRREYEAVFRELAAAGGHRLVRLRGHAEVERWLAGATFGPRPRTTTHSAFEKDGLSTGKLTQRRTEPSSLK